MGLGLVLLCITPGFGVADFCCTWTLMGVAGAIGTYSCLYSSVAGLVSNFNLTRTVVGPGWRCCGMCGAVRLQFATPPAVLPAVAVSTVLAQLVRGTCRGTAGGGRWSKVGGHHHPSPRLPHFALLAAVWSLAMPALVAICDSSDRFSDLALVVGTVGS